MQSLREVTNCVHPPLAIPGMRMIASLLETEEPITLRKILQYGAAYRRISLVSLTFQQQNLGLFPLGLVELPNPAGGTIGVFPLYEGSERSKVLPRMIEILRNEKPDVIGFSEFWKTSEREGFIRELDNIYPYHLSGPFEGDPRAIEVEYFDGGLLLMSRHPIIEQHYTIYRQCEGEDCFTNKGVLHAQIKINGHLMNYDVFLTHMQSCPPKLPVPTVGQGDCFKKLQVYQVLHLRDFIQSYSSPDRPALLMGDLNHDGVNPTSVEYQSLVAFLEMPIDLWLVSGNSTSGITRDTAVSFSPDSTPLPVDDKLHRNKNGTRLDYFFAWPGMRQLGVVSTGYDWVEIVRYQTSPGRDLSDHYGLKCHLRCVREYNVDCNEPISTVSIIPAGLRCLRETAGPMPIISEETGSDEIDLTLTYRTATGLIYTSNYTPNKDVNSGDFIDMSGIRDMYVQWNDPGDYVEIEAHLDEIDEGLGIETGRISLGTRKLHIERVDLLKYKGQDSIPRTLPIFQGGGGEYALTIKIKVE